MVSAFLIRFTTLYTISGRSCLIDIGILFYKIIFIFYNNFCDLGRIQTCNLLSRNQMRYSVAPRGLLRRQIYPILPSLQNYKARIVT